MTITSFLIKWAKNYVESSLETPSIVLKPSSYLPLHQNELGRKGRSSYFLQEDHSSKRCCFLTFHLEKHFCLGNSCETHIRLYKWSIHFQGFNSVHWYWFAFFSKGFVNTRNTVLKHTKACCDWVLSQKYTPSESYMRAKGMLFLRFEVHFLSAFPSTWLFIFLDKPTGKQNMIFLFLRSSCLPCFPSARQLVHGEPMAILDLRSIGIAPDCLALLIKARIAF